MPKTYVIDTNVLIQAPYAIECFQENQVVLPLVVLEELDGLKKAEGEKGANARAAIRRLEKFRLAGDLLQGVTMQNGGVIRIEPNCVNVELPEHMPDNRMDNRILKVCKGLQEKENKVILVTKDIVLRMKAQILSLESEDFTTEQVSSEGAQYSGRTECYTSSEKFKDFKKKGIALECLYQVDGQRISSVPALTENEFVILRDDQSIKKTHLGRVEKGKLVPLQFQKTKPYGVSPRNVG